MAKNPTKGFTLDQLKKASDKSQKEMVKNADILNKQNPETGGPNYEKKEEFDFPGADGYEAKEDSPLNAYVSTAGHFQRLQDNIAAAFTPKKKTGPTSEDKKNQAEEAYWKSKTTTSEENNPFKDRVNQIEDDSSSNFDVDLKYNPSTNYSGTFEDSKKRNPFDIGQGVDKSKNYFKKFGQ